MVSMWTVVQTVIIAPNCIVATSIQHPCSIVAYELDLKYNANLFSGASDA